MTTFYLIRHGSTDFIGKVLVGRMPGIHLNTEGRIQASRLAERFRGIPISRIYSSPIERARETAEPLSRELGIAVEIAEEVSEVEYGEWTGRPISDLLNDPAWQHYNSFRTGAHVPGGESVLELQNRLAGWLESTRRAHTDERIAVVSHGDPIKAALAHYMGLHLDMFPRFEISPASVSVVQVNDAGACVLALNNSELLP